MREPRVSSTFALGAFVLGGRALPVVPAATPLLVALLVGCVLEKSHA